MKKSVELFWNELTKMHKNYIPNSFYEYLQNKYNDLYKKTILYNDTDLNKFSKYYKSLKQNIDYLNKKYIEKELVNNKEYFDTLFEYSLAEDQRKAIITDDDYNLIIAGAGSGKTSTLIGKVNYLIEKKGINPNEIVAISFTNAAVDNFKNKLKNDNVKCTTFHRLRKVILGKSIFCDKGLLETVIRQYLSEEILKDEKRLTQFVELFSLYPQRILSYDENTDEKYYQKQSIKAKYKKYEKINKDKELLFTLDNDKVMSYEELIIANYLFIGFMSSF